MTRWGMVIDLNRCVGCQTCAIACKHQNATPPGVQWRQVLDVEQGEYPDVERLFMVVGCQHCAEPPCVPVCPTGATAQRADGLVTMDYDLCIGCAACAVACPYQARTIVHHERGYYGAPTVQEKKVAHHERRGVAQKCTFCIERVDDGLANGLSPGVDPLATPACAASCITQAIHFGDFADPDSNVSRLVRDNNSFQMHQHLGTDPQIRYLYELPHMPGREADAHDLDDAVQSDAANPLVGARQPFWDWKGAGNFVLGGFASGFAVMAYVLHLAGGATGGATLPYAYAAAGGIMGLGLLGLLFKIGRPLRALNATRRPQSSWMSRELYAAVAFYLVLALDLLWPAAPLHPLVALAAAAFLVCQARILYASKGIPTWRAPLIPWMLVATGLYEGSALMMLGGVLFAPAMPLGDGTAAAGIVLALVNGALWWRYVASAKAAGIGPLSRADLAQATPLIHGIGHVIPVALLAVAWLAPAELARVCFGLAGLAILFAGAYWKLVVVLRACHQQGFGLPRMPQRGSGRFAAPPRLEVA